MYGGSYVNLVLMPFKVFGYLVLATLVYATVIEATKNMLSGVVGLFSCVSCTFPVLAALASGFFGSSSAVAAAVYSQSYGLSTAVFVLTVALLLWRPSFPRLS